MAAIAEGAHRVEVTAAKRIEFTFELGAGSPEAACERVTTIFRSVYGLNWQAEVSPVEPARIHFSRSAAWN